MKKSIVLYLHVHQPYRIKHYSVFDAGHDHNYFNSNPEHWANNENIIKKVATKSYLPTNATLLSLLERNPQFCFSLSITGTLLDQLEAWSPETLQSFQKLVATGRVEIVAETYHHSLAFFYSKPEFEAQVAMHTKKIEQLFGFSPQIFRNTELAYNNDLALWAEQAGYKGIIAEGWDPVLQWRSPNYVYSPFGTSTIGLLLKNYKLSDDIAFRFSNREWTQWPLTAEKYTHWLNETKDATNFNLFMDYETFGEHQWEDTGIFDFLRQLPKQWCATEGNTFQTISGALDSYQPVGSIDMPYTVTWADTERDLTAWLGNPMQQQAITALYSIEKSVIESGDQELIEDWRKLQTSDHFYYMCTKWFTDGDVHAYFSPYETPYEAFMNFMNSYQDMRYRLSRKGLVV